MKTWELPRSIRAVSLCSFPPCFLASFSFFLFFTRHLLTDHHIPSARSFTAQAYRPASRRGGLRLTRTPARRVPRRTQGEGAPERGSRVQVDHSSHITDRFPYPLPPYLLSVPIQERPVTTPSRSYLLFTPFLRPTPSSAHLITYVTAVSLLMLFAQSGPLCVDPLPLAFLRSSLAHAALLASCCPPSSSHSHTSSIPYPLADHE